MLPGHAQHTPGAAGRVKQGVHHTGLAQDVIVRLEEEVDHELTQLPLKHLLYVEFTGEVRYSPPQAISKLWEHAKCVHPQALLPTSGGTWLPFANPRELAWWTDRVTGINTPVRVRVVGIIDAEHVGEP